MIWTSTSFFGDRFPREKWPGHEKLGKFGIRGGGGSLKIKVVTVASNREKGRKAARKEGL